MTLKQYFPLSIAVLLGTIAIVNATPAPLAPFIIILLANAETLSGIRTGGSPRAQATARNLPQPQFA